MDKVKELQITFWGELGVGDPSARPERDGARRGREQSQQTLTCDSWE